MTQIKIRGLPAVIVLAGIVAIAAFRMVTARETLASEGAQELTTWLRAEYTARYLQSMEGSGPTEADADSLINRSQVEITAIRGHGTPDDMVVRAEIAVNGQPPPDGRRVRYWRMRYSTLTGWRMEREANVLLYYLNVF